MSRYMVQPSTIWEQENDWMIEVDLYFYQTMLVCGRVLLSLNCFQLTIKIMLMVHNGEDDSVNSFWQRSCSKTSSPSCPALQMSSAQLSVWNSPIKKADLKHTHTQNGIPQLKAYFYWFTAFVFSVETAAGSALV